MDRERALEIQSQKLEGEVRSLLAKLRRMEELEAEVLALKSMADGQEKRADELKARNESLEELINRARKAFEERDAKPEDL